MRKMNIALIAIVLLSSCTTNMGKFAMLSTQDVDLKKQYTQIQEAVEGTSTVHIICIVPTSFGTTPLYAEAAKDAMAKSGADYLENADVETSFFYLPFIYGQMTATVKGLAYKAK